MLMRTLIDDFVHLSMMIANVVSQAPMVNCKFLPETSSPDVHRDANLGLESSVS